MQNENRSNNPIQMQMKTGLIKIVFGKNSNENSPNHTPIIQFKCKSQCYLTKHSILHFYYTITTQDYLFLVLEKSNKNQRNSP